MADGGSVDGKGIGARVLRKEDARHLAGKGKFTSDFKRPGQKEMAFVRASVAHAHIKSIVKPAGYEHAIFTSEDLPGLKPMRALSKLPGYKLSDYPALAAGKVRFAGEPVAVCVADSRADAEDIAQMVEVEYDILPAVTDMLAAKKPDAPLVHDEWEDNIVFETFSDDDFQKIADEATVVIRREYRMNRQAMNPMEGKAVFAEWDDRQDQLMMWTSTQVPHLIRNGLAEFLDLEQRQVRVIAPDVGGGFGCKALLQPEELVAGYLTRKLECPIRWIEDRREHLVTGANCREHHYQITLHATPDGRMLGLDCDVTVDAGAYSVYPFTNGLEGAMAHGNLPGPYDFKAYKCRTQTTVTNKPGLMPYRGVARPGVCFAMEMTIDALAREIGMEAHEIRMKNMVPESAMPFMSIAKKHFDSGNYAKSVEMAVNMIGLEKVRASQGVPTDDGRIIGVGMGSYVEQTAHGTSVFSSWGVAMVPGYEQATVRLTPDGGLELRIGVQSHGQGMETSMAQMACEVLGIDPDNVMVTHGDTGLTPYSTGTYASRSMVMAGGATARACRVLAERMEIIGAHLMQCERTEVSIAGGKVVSGKGEVSFAEIGRVWYLNPDELPEDVDQGGVEVTMGYRPEPDSGAFTYASHACKISLDVETGKVKVLDYVIVEDCGTIVNPMIVEGQTFGGATQGIGTALLEESLYDEMGNPGASTFADYMMPSATDAPMYRVDHMESPSPFTEYGIKGMGEGGTIPTPAAIGNAINDALKQIGAEVMETPFTPRRVRAAIEAARDRKEGEAA
ncbi:MAG: xanthine dehydrogenase family protein molybdopterin-binding subunit [Pseudomonadota bacterium]|nr:xanthine dehydrogenase family protein molybdopterin-binding subunit [Pseudomonadota bacterium]MEC8724722.1 xanthine dehydrogenase family protein molybdopterin-binding subunit [Pseudomonadota bacterium]